MIHIKLQCSLALQSFARCIHSRESLRLKSQGKMFCAHSISLLVVRCVLTSLEFVFCSRLPQHKECTRRALSGALIIMLLRLASELGKIG